MGVVMNLSDSFNNMFTYKISDDIEVSKRIMAKIEKRGISKEDLASAINQGDVLFSEVDRRFGTKYQSVVPGLARNLTVVWFVNPRGLKQIVTAFWRKKKI